MTALQLLGEADDDKVADKMLGAGNILIDLGYLRTKKLSSQPTNTLIIYIYYKYIHIYIYTLIVTHTYFYTHAHSCGVLSLPVWSESLRV